MTGDALDKNCSGAIGDLKKKLVLSNNSQALAAAGIDYSKHSKQPLRAALEIIDKDVKKAMIKIGVQLNANDIDLSDSAFNSSDAIDLSAFIADYELDQCRCCTPIKGHNKAINLRESKFTFGGWNQFLEHWD